MNIVPLIQEKWSFIGTRLKLSSDKLDRIWQSASEQEIPPESTDTFCCVKMLTSWYETSDNVSADAIITAVDASHVGLKTKVKTITAALTSEYVAIDSSTGKFVTNPPEKLEQSYFDMKTKFCLELGKSEHSIHDILVYLRVCNIDSEILEGISDFPELVRSFEKHKLLNKTDLSWLKNIADHVQCTTAAEVIECYEHLLMADKISWYSSHPKGTFLVGRTDKKSESVTIKDSSNAKSVVSRIVSIQETDSILESSEVGSVIFYWRLINKDIQIQFPEVVNTSIIKDCKNAGLTHIGIMINGDLNLRNIDELGMYLNSIIICTAIWLTIFIFINICRIAQNFGGKKHWRMNLYLPMFFCQLHILTTENVEYSLRNVP